MYRAVFPIQVEMKESLQVISSIKTVCAFSRIFMRGVNAIYTSDNDVSKL